MDEMLAKIYLTIFGIFLYRKQGNDYKQVLIQIEGLYMALLDLESDQLKLSALPTNAPLREQVLIISNKVFGLKTWFDPT